MKKENFEKFTKAIEDMENSEGFKLDSLTRQLEYSFNITVVNFGYLEKLLANVPTSTVEQKHRGESEKFQVEALRLLSNYLDSAMALRDHMRNYIRRVYGSTDKALDGEYRKKVDELKDSNLMQFIEDLRNYRQHHWILPIKIVTKVVDEKFNSKILLSRGELKESNFNWGKGKAFLNSEEGDIDVLSITKDFLYGNIFPWLMQKQSDYHKKEFDELKHLREKARNLYKE